MSKTHFEKTQYLSKYSKNPKITEEYIKKYRNLTKGTVEHILQISECVRDMKVKEKSGELNNYDMKYFCHSVGITEGSSTFRKFMCISERVDVFRKYLDRLPDSYTVLYQITTLDPDKFEELMNNNLIHSYVTLKDIKQLSGKVPPVNNSTNNLVTHRQMSKLIKSINKFTITVSREIPESEFNSIIYFLEELQNKKYVSFEIPQVTEFIEEVVLEE